MEQLIPIFPLEVVVYPGDELNLHIFEPRYQQLINDTVKTKKPFGIPAVVNKKLGGLGTTVALNNVSNVQADGQMDIKTEGQRIFRVVRWVKLYPGKLYSAAVVEYPEIDGTGDAAMMRKIVAATKKLHGLLHVKKKLPKPESKLTSYDMAHHVGLNPEQEYALLGLFTEVERQRYLLRHLEQVLPVVAGMESLKEKIQLNGHFRNLPGFDI
jgi:Lon protease-like protein